MTVRCSFALSVSLPLQVFLQTTRYLEQLLEVRDAVGPTLMLLGDGNWRMGDGIKEKTNQGKPATGCEGSLIEHFVCTQALSLSVRSREEWQSNLTYKHR